MSIASIQTYYSEVEKLIRFGGTRKETSIRTPFINLINEYAKGKDFMLVPEVSIKTLKGTIIMPDGTLRNNQMKSLGYYESKDEADNIDEEIKKKFQKGYPNDNILFEDSITAVLFHEGIEVMRVKINEPKALNEILNAFINYESEDVILFNQAIELFKRDVPNVTDTIKGIIQAQEKTNKKFIEAQDDFIELCRTSINPQIAKTDIQEMMIQHILTADIFNTIFDEPHFHRENNIAKELENVIDTFFTGNTRRVALGSMERYYQAINASAHSIADHHEKQKFLKVIYETFYKSYNPKAADKLGVVYTPNEIVKFMIESTDHLLQKHFGKMLHDKGVEILDPATGTGTFICDIIDYIHPNKLEYKYKNELHANEVAILPYYIANLNIEFTYKQKMKKYEEFESLCFVDTLDNVGFGYKDKQTDMFGMSAENAERIKKQNDRKISVVIGNPPYNANQMSENDNNKNRTYKIIDERIKNTFIKYSTAQKTKVYDMYARFYRWAFDRLNDNGVVAFITNRSFIDSRTFDGFRKVVASEFNYIYIVDLGGDVRANPKLSGTKHNVFGIQTGVAIMFLIRKNNKIVVDTKKELNQLKKELDALEEPVVKYGEQEYLSTCATRILYTRRPEFDTAKEKTEYLRFTKFDDIDFERIDPDKTNNWVNLAEDNDWESLTPIANKDTKLGKKENAIFKLNTLGVVTARDEWVLDFDSKKVINKVKYLISLYNIDTHGIKNKNRNEVKISIGTKIKWSRAVINDLINGVPYKFNKNDIVIELSRPYVKKHIYFNRKLNEMQYQLHQVFGHGNNTSIIFSAPNSNVSSVLATNHVFEYKTAGTATGGTESVSLYRYTSTGERLDNITKWGLEQFQTHYQNKKITKEQIFNYCYAALHNPAYRKKYELNLKRELPRIPFYDDFNKWEKWGRQLMDLHINYETVKPFKLKEITDKALVAEMVAERNRSSEATKSTIKVKLKADKETGTITIDEATELKGVPKEAWLYKLGNRSAIEWVLDQYKEKKPSDPTILEHFNTYKFADYKTQVIDLLMRVTTVSVETMAIINEMEKEIN